jgi:hypothetical protein
MQELQNQVLQDLYDRDNYLWLEHTLALLRRGEFEGLDLSHLIEELEDLGKRDLNKAKSLLRQIMVHLLLSQYWQQKYELNYRHWRSGLIAFRDDVNMVVTTSLKNKLSADLDRIYQVALSQVVQKTGLPEATFPSNCPYKFEQLLTNWYPNETSVSSNPSVSPESGATDLQWPPS